MKDKRLENIEIALLELAEAVESGEWHGVYQNVANIIHPVDEKKED